MEPRSFDRGGRAGPGQLPARGAASMEPRSFDRGGAFNRGFGQWLFPLLQWSRGLSTAEGNLYVLDGDTGLVLQWSRGLSTAEGSAPASAPARGSGFNGAAVFRPRRGRSSKHAGSTCSRFNGAAVFRPRRVPSAVERALRSSASMEPRSFDRGGRSCSAPPGGTC